jgi:hypothetical protein
LNLKARKQKRKFITSTKRTAQEVGKAIEKVQKAPEQQKPEKVEQAVEDIPTEKIEKAIEATKEPEKKFSEKAQGLAEEASDYLANVALASAGAAVAAPPTAPVSLALSKTAGITSSGLDLIALALSALNGDKEGVARNGAALAIGVATSFIPGGEGAKKIAKEATQKFAKDAIEMGANKLLKKGLQQLNKEKEVEIGGQTFNKEQLNQLGQNIYNSSVNKVEQDLSGKTGEGFEKLTNDAKEKVGNENALVAIKNAIAPYVAPTRGEEVSQPETPQLERQQYLNIANNLIEAGVLQSPLLDNDLVKIYVAWWLMEETGQPSALQEAVFGVENTKLTDFNEKSEVLSAAEKQKLMKLFQKNRDAFGELMKDLESFANPKNSEEKEQAKQYLVPLSKEESVPKEVIDDIAKKVDKTGQFLIQLRAQEPTEPEAEEDEEKLLPVVSEQEAEGEAQEDIQPENETEPQAYDQRHYTTLATFFADKGGKGLGFMQQLLLRRQSEQLFGLIKTLDALIDPNAGEEKAINEINNIIKEQEEKPVVLDQEEKRKLKSRLLGLLSLLKSLKTLSKAYEENLTRTSLDPRYDGSSLKRRLDSMLPDVQDSISEIIESINEFTSQKKELQEQKNKDPERQEKIDLVSDVYKDMRVIWQTTLGDMLSKRLKKEEKIDEQEDVQQTETVEASAKAMRDLATNPEFIKLFPTSRLTQSGEVVSIEEANKALTGVISEFIYVMRNVVALVKGENVTPETAKEVKSKLVDIAEAIENYFDVPAGKLAKEAEKEEASEPSSQSLTDTPLLPPPSTPDSVEREEDEDFGFDDTEKEDEFNDMSPEQESRTLEKEVEKFSKFIEREEGARAKQVILLAG